MLARYEQVKRQLRLMLIAANMVRALLEIIGAVWVSWIKWKTIHLEHNRNLHVF
ncbi:hypothetical protein K449DRAFT_391649 [Hypoxylon sp. EC38]|nr:hypothetical protein K449DRAFT_391649 [Hypoxylon sp. EC38]